MRPSEHSKDIRPDSVRSFEEQMRIISARSPRGGAASPPSPHAIAFAITGRLANLFPRWINDNIEDDWGLSAPELLLIGLLSRAGDMTMGEAAIALDLTPGAITRIVKELESEGLVERNANPRDRRQTLISLTASARVKADVLIPQHDALIDRIFSTLTEKEILEYVRVAIILAEGMRPRPKAH